jgi:hypothetical protein
MHLGRCRTGCSPTCSCSWTLILHHSEFLDAGLVLSVKSYSLPLLPMKMDDTVGLVCKKSKYCSGCHTIRRRKSFCNPKTPNSLFKTCAKCRENAMVRTDRLRARAVAAGERWCSVGHHQVSVAACTNSTPMERSWLSVWIVAKDVGMCALLPLLTQILQLWSRKSRTATVATTGHIYKK